MEGTRNIQDLLPHREPFLFVDEIVTVSSEEIVAVTIFDDRYTLLRSGFTGTDYIPEAILLESMAQCGGAGMRLLGVSKGVFALVNIESAVFYNYVKLGQHVKFVLKNLRMSEKIIRQSGKAYVGDELIFEASWMSIRIG